MPDPNHRSVAIRPISRSAATDWIQAPTGTLIVAGSGLSISPPAAIPSVDMFLGRVARLLEQASGYASLPPSATAGDDYTRRLFPEVMYGAIAEAYETRAHLEIWKALDEDNAERAGSRPNAGHLAVAMLASQRTWPVVTTNFDCQIETAAAIVNAQVTRHLLHQNDGLSVAGAPGVVQLVKVHGTADDPTTIRSMASDLSRSHRTIKRIEFRPKPERVLVIGYSGRDFDLFPWLVETFRGSEVLWVDPRFDERHRASGLPGVLAYQGSWEDLAGPLLDANGIDSPAAPPTGPVAYGEIIDDLVEKHCRRMISEAGSERAVAAMLGVLVACGANRGACNLAEQRLTTQTRGPDEAMARIQTLLWAAGASSSVDRFATALNHAKEALGQARAFGTRREQGRAAIAVAYARVSARWLQVPGVPIESVSRSGQLWALTAPIWVALYYAPDAVRWHRELTRSLGNEFDPRTYRFVTDYLEHLIRLMAFVDKLGRSHLVPERWIRSTWRRLSDACSNAGYTLGVFNVSKYTTRHSEAYDAPDAAIAASLVMGDLVGQAIAHRDAGLGHLARKSTPGISVNPADSETARRLLSVALDLAQTLGCPSLQLKCLVVMREAGLIAPLELGTVKGLLDACQAPTLKSQQAALTRILEGVPA